MTDVERKLAKYRAQKERETKYNTFKAHIKSKLASFFIDTSVMSTYACFNIFLYILCLTLILGTFAKFAVQISEESDECLLKSEAGEQNVCHTIQDNLSDISSVDSEDDDVTLRCCSYMDCLYYLLCFILWAIVYIIFIKLQFGTVYLILSGLIGIYLNTRTGPKRKGEISAYSVFNKDCKSIDGTLKAEQFEREIRYGPSVVH